MEMTRLIERCRQGDAEALGELYKAYAQKMRRVCRRYVSDEQTVDDVLHDAFVIIFTSFDRLRDARKAESWMMAITRNVASKYKDHLSAVPTVSLDDAENISAPEGETTVRGIPLDEVMRLIDRLPEGYANVFRLSVFEGLSHKEIAALLGIEPHSSSSQLTRAKKQLQKLLARYWMWLLLPVALYFYTRNKPTENRQSTATKHDKQTTTKNPTNPDESAKQPSPTPQTAVGYAQHHTADSTGAADTLRHVAEQRERTDTTAAPPKRPTPDIRHDKDVNIAETERYPMMPPQKVKPMNWSIGLTYSGVFNRSADTSSLIPTWGPGSDQADFEPETHWRTTHHDLPFTVSLALRRQVTQRWAIETGINYTRLSSQFTTETSQTELVEAQKMHYLGIPLSVACQWFETRSWRLYTSVSATLEIPVRATLTTEHRLNGAAFDSQRQSFHAPLQWSVGTGIGLQYNITPGIGLFAEPRLQYFIPTGSDVETYRTEHPLNFTVPLGLRFTW